MAADSLFVVAFEVCLLNLPCSYSSAGCCLSAVKLPRVVGHFSPYSGLALAADCALCFLQVAAEREKVQLEEEAAKTKAEVVPPKKEVQTPKTYRQGIGKYINMAAA